MSVKHLQPWVGRTIDVSDTASRQQHERLAALLDHRTAPWRSGELMPLSHWLYFLPNSPESDLDVDGHPKRGDFLPPIDRFPRRMWAGSRLSFNVPVPLESTIRRRSTIKSIASKTGATGEMIFVTVSHEIFVGDVIAISEEQDIVYRGTTTVSPTLRRTIANLPSPDLVRTVSPDTVMLFRYSALTFNAHRIHYDRDYACRHERYSGLVVQGPLVATLLADHFLRRFPEVRVRRLEFRAERPMFDGITLDLCLHGDLNAANLWAQTQEGIPTMRARIEAE